MTLSVLLSLVGFLLTIGIVVMIHEGGHYLAAKWPVSYTHLTLPTTVIV